ncbi:hypothetical protein E1263_38510 [Kribbella antibiotica]|uniref:TPM domain-containing protein n=1 Tax=Kribbella antibiotica TaxID=190195 RepID=A0A4R4YKJ8_9ACTN|nr:hypothetical protein [Kribbella antibiotica]TDD45505.1 hypothetical protein E1263_38510 [Kribbella antibiotica]
MSAHLRRLAALLAVLVALPVLPAHAATPSLPDRIAAGWQTDRVFVDPRLTVPLSEVARIRAEAAKSSFAVYVALVPRTPYLRESLFDLPTLLQARTGQPGLYIVRVVTDEYWSGVEELYRPGGLKGRDLNSVKGDDKQRLDIVDNRPAPQIVRIIQQAQTAYDGRALPAASTTDLEPPRPPRRPSSTAKEDKGAFIGLGVGGLLGFALTLTLVLRRRRPGSGSKAVESGAVQPSGYQIEIRRQADQAITRAGQSIRKLEKRSELTVALLDRRDDANRRLDAARTLRADQPDDLLAVTGALVLARQARQAADGSAVRPPCFFDPTHRAGTAHVPWGDAVEVPACRPCAERLGKGKTPHGLRVSRSVGLLGRSHETVPYWTLDPKDNPMVATGFGALTDDLAERVSGRLDDVR